MSLFDEVKIQKDKRSRENTSLKPRVIKYLERLEKAGHELLWYKNWGGIGKSGRPDLEVIFLGQTFYFELKDKSEPDTVQEATLAKMDRIGVPAYVAYTLEEVQAVLESAIEQNR